MSGSTIGTVQAEFVADTQNFDASVRGAEERMKQAGAAAEQMGDKVIAAGEKTDRAAKLQEQAAERARRAWQREMRQQDQAIEREQSAARAAELSALKMAILARSEDAVNTAMHGAVPATSAASAAMRTLEGNFSHNIRAAERFMSTTLGLGPLLEKAFPVVGAVALGGALVEMGNRVKEVLDKAREAPRTIEMSFRSMEYASMSANAELQKSNDELQRQIDKIEHHPENNLAKALDEARVEAVRLGQSLDETLGKVKALLKENEVGSFSALVQNQRRIPDEMRDEYLGKLNSLSDLGYEKSVATNRGDLGAAGRYQTQIDNLRKEIIAKADQQIREASQPTIDAGKAFGPEAGIGALFGAVPDKIQTSKMMGDPSAMLNFLHGLRNQEQMELSHEALESTNQKLTGQLDTLNGRKDASEAAKKAEEEAAKAQQRELVQLENHLKEMQAEFNLGAGMAQTYWESVLASHRWGEAATERILSHVAESTQQFNTSITSRILAMKKLQAELGEAPQFRKLEPTDNDTFAMTRLGLERMKNEAQFSTSMAQYGFADSHDQAVDEARRHLELYRAEVRGLGAELKALQQEDAFGAAAGLGEDPQRKVKEASLGNQIDALANNAQIQAMQDHIKELETSWKGMIGSVFDEIARQSQNTVAEIHRVTSQFVSGSNDQIVNGMLGQKMNWSGVFSQAAHGIGKSGLENVEGTGLKMLGFGGGKRDGQQMDRSLYVTITNEAALAKGGTLSGPLLGAGSFGVSGDSTGADLAGGVLSGVGAAPSSTAAALSGGAYRAPAVGRSVGSSMSTSAASVGSRTLMSALNDSDTLGGLFGGHLFGSGSLFGGFRAAGGGVEADTPYIVGERGPELMIPGTRGSIVPNHQLASVGGSTSYTIDARGTDPALTTANVQRAIEQSRVQAVHQAAATMAEHQRRIPQ